MTTGTSGPVDSADLAHPADPDGPLDPAEPAEGPRRFPWGTLLCVTGVLLVVSVAALVAWEMRTSTLQARYFSSVAERLTFEGGTGPSEAVRFPNLGPYDARYGYHTLPDMLGTLAGQAFVVEEQARQSDDFVAWPPRGPTWTDRSRSRRGSVCSSTT